MGKILFWIVAIAIGFGVYRLLQIMERKSQQARDQRPDPEEPRELVMQCRHCGVHIPASEAVMDGEHAYCSEAHRQAG
ncbi:MAG: PP0621 family protein [Burkholderiaceae bacterium]